MKNALQSIVFSLCIATVFFGCYDAHRPGGRVVFEDEHYTVHAYDSTGIRYVAEQMEVTVSRFAEMFDAYPPHLFVVVMNTPGMLSDVDRQRLGLAGEAHVLPVLPERFDRAPEVNVYGLPDQPLIFSLIAPATAATVFRTGMRQFQKRDTIRSLNDRPVASMNDIIAVYEDIPIGSEVRWIVQNNGKRKVVYTRSGTAHALQPHSKTTHEGGGSLNRFVSHEAGHMLHQNYAAQECSRTKQDGAWVHRRDNGKVGPDWFDEMVASLLESPDVPYQSIEFLQNRRKDRIPLAHYFEMMHPLQHIPTEFQDIIKSRTAGDQAVTGTFSIVVHRNTSLIEGELDLLFYAQTHAFGHYLQQHEGTVFIGNMSRVLTCGGTMEDILPKMQVLPTSLPDLEQHWSRWLSSQAVPSI